MPKSPESQPSQPERPSSEPINVEALDDAALESLGKVSFASLEESVHSGDDFATILRRNTSEALRAAGVDADAVGDMPADELVDMLEHADQLARARRADEATPTESGQDRPGVADIEALIAKRKELEELLASGAQLTDEPALSLAKEIQQMTPAELPVAEAEDSAKPKTPETDRPKGSLDQLAENVVALQAQLAVETDASKKGKVQSELEASEEALRYQMFNLYWEKGEGAKGKLDEIIAKTGVKIEAKSSDKKESGDRPDSQTPEQSSSADVDSQAYVDSMKALATYIYTMKHQLERRRIRLQSASDPDVKANLETQIDSLNDKIEDSEKKLRDQLDRFDKNSSREDKSSVIDSVNTASVSGAENGSSDQLAEESGWRGTFNRIRRKTSDRYHKIAAWYGASMMKLGERKAWAAEERQPGESQVEYEERLQKRGRNKVLGAAAVAVVAAGAVWAARSGALDSLQESWNGLFDGSELNGVIGDETAEPSPSPQAGESPTGESEVVGGGEGDGTDVIDETEDAPSEEVVIDWSEYADAVNIEAGEGWYQTFTELGVLADKHKQLLDAVGPELESQGIAYWDAAAGEYRMNMTPDGKMPTEALEAIVKAAHENNIDTAVEAVTPSSPEQEPTGSFTVEPGHGYTPEIIETAEALGGELDKHEAWQTHQDIVDAVGPDYIDLIGHGGPDTYSMGDSPYEVGISAPGEATWDPTALDMIKEAAGVTDVDTGAASTSGIEAADSGSEVADTSGNEGGEVAAAEISASSVVDSIMESYGTELAEAIQTGDFSAINKLDASVTEQLAEYLRGEVYSDGTQIVSIDQYGRHEFNNRPEGETSAALVRLLGVYTAKQFGLAA